MNHSLGQVNSRDYRVYNPDKRERRKEENESLKDLKELENLLKEKDRSISDISKEMNITAARAKSMITSLSTLEGSKLFDYKKKVPNNKKGIIMYSWLS
jgi:Mn-dependent DtxR family transcriptional regulator